MLKLESWIIETVVQKFYPQGFKIVEIIYTNIHIR